MGGGRRIQIGLNDSPAIRSAEPKGTRWAMDVLKRWASPRFGHQVR